MAGKIKVITGCMFSGKSNKLIEESEKYDSCKLFKPKIDDRYSKNKIETHDNKQKEAININKEEPEELLNYSKYSAICIDEVNLFSEDIVNIIEKLSLENVDILVAGIDQDYKGKPFQPVPKLMVKADEIVKLKSECKKCGSKATKNQKKINNNDRIEIGGSKIYEPRCRECHYIP